MMCDQLDLHLDPDDRPPHSHQRLPPLHNSLLRVSGRAKIATLKKYLVMKLGLKDSSRSSVRFYNFNHLLCEPPSIYGQDTCSMWFHTENVQSEIPRSDRTNMLQ
jgi:hypothetical protein